MYWLFDSGPRSIPTPGAYVSEEHLELVAKPQIEQEPCCIRCGKPIKTHKDEDFGPLGRCNFPACDRQRF